jgi:anaerobic selenocysteine-containing dehydrogenase
MSATRRELFLMTAAGAGVGVVFSPVPWKLLDDVSIWTQNWSWLPRHPRGEITITHTACPLCPAGCGLKVRRVNEVPFAVSSTPGGALCARGFAGHQLPFHPSRLRTALHQGQPAPVAEALAGAAAAVEQARRSGAVVAVLDQRPGRMVSVLYRQFLTGFPRALYVTLPTPEEGTLRAVAELTGRPLSSLGYDFEGSRTIFGVGAPLLDHWGAPGRLLRLWGAPQRKVRFWHAATTNSRTAALADRWMAIRPDSEHALVRGLISLLIRAHGAGSGMALPSSWAAFAPEEAAERTGVPLAQIQELAQELATAQPAVAVGGGDPVAGPLPAATEQALAVLNALLGALGTPGGIVERRPVPEPALPSGLPAETTLARAPARSIGLLIVDSASSGCAWPLELIQDKLAPDAVTIHLSAFRTAWTAHATWTMPVPAPFEALEEIPGPPGARAASWSLAKPLFPAPEEAIPPEAVLHRLGLPEDQTLEALLQAKAAAIEKAGRGVVRPLATPDESAPVGEGLWDQLTEGAVWVDDAEPASRPLRAAISALPDPTPVTSTPQFPLLATPSGSRGGAGSMPAPPLASKLTRESHLEPAAGEVRVHPRTAESRGLTHRGRAVMATPKGEMAVVVRTDPGMAEGLVEVAVEGDRGTETLALFPVTEDGAWRWSPAQLRRA